MRMAKKRRIIIFALSAAMLLCSAACSAEVDYGADTIRFELMDNGEYCLTGVGGDTSYAELAEKYAPASAASAEERSSLSLADQPAPHCGNLFLGQSRDEAAHSMFGSETTGRRLSDAYAVFLNADGSAYWLSGVYGDTPFFYMISGTDEEVTGLSLKFNHSDDIEDAVNKWVAIRDRLIKQIGRPEYKLADDVWDNNPYAELSEEEILQKLPENDIARVAVAWGDSRYYSLVLSFDISADGKARRVELTMIRS